MQHLQNLKILNYVMAGLYALALLVVLAAVAMMLVMGIDQGAEDMVPAVAGSCCATLIVGAFVGLFAMAGRKVADGEGRILQTILAVLLLGNCPGIFYAVYALWVCWVNPETKAAFDRAG